MSERKRANSSSDREVKEGEWLKTPGNIKVRRTDTRDPEMVKVKFLTKIAGWVIS